MTKYDRLKFKQIQERDELILEELDRIFKSIQEKSKNLASNVYQKSEGNENYFTDRPNRKKSFAKTVNEELKPDYIKKDKFIYDRYAEEYRTTYLYDKFVFESNALMQGFKITIPRYQKKQFVKALENPISKLANTTEMSTTRAVNLQQIYKTIVTGVETGQSLDNIVKNIDVNLGYRDRQTLKVIAKPEAYKGQFYRSKRILRTEVGRIRSEADRDRWINTQEIAPSKMQLVETLDNRTRSQSANMDGQFANEEGKFLYPNGWGWKYLRQSGNPSFDINDRGRTINIDPEYPPESRLEKDKNGNYQEKPFNTFKEYAERNNLRVNKYGEVLFK